MGRRSKPLDPQNPLHRFASELRSLCDAAGAEGSCQATCKRAGITRTTYYAWLSGKQLPGVDALGLTVKAWGGDTVYWMNRRREVEQELAGLAVRRQTRRPEPQLSGGYLVTRPKPGGVAKAEPLQRVADTVASVAHRDESNSIAARVLEARQVLTILGFDDERSNERSALVLLALLALGPGQEWGEAARPIVRTREMMDWIRVHYERNYAANTRETLRRFTLHQFIDHGLVVPNPDDPGRPINSPRWCYQISKSHFELLCTYGRRDFWRKLADYFRSF
jgi:transcriptional regulator with XRE-family HTH domain